LAPLDADGRGVVDPKRLYQLMRQNANSTDHILEIEFLDSGVQALTFG